MALSGHPRADQLKRALTWIGQRRAEDPSAPLVGLIEAAALEFDLSPLDEEFLIRQLRLPEEKPAG